MISTPSYQNSQKLFQFEISMPKEFSYFVYFILESIEGVCFYSTLEHIPHQTTRVLDIRGSIEHREEFLTILQMLQKKCSLTILTDKTIQE